MVIVLPLVFLLGAIPLGVSIRIERGSDPCRLDVRVPDALRQMMPGVDVHAEGDARSPVASGRLRLVLRPRGGEVDLELVDEAGRAVLERTLVSREGACAGTADGIALIVERHLRDLGYQPTVPSPADPSRTGSEALASRTEDEEGVASPSAPSRAVTSTAARAPSSSGAPSSSALSLEVGAKGASEVFLSPLRGTAGGRLLFRLVFGAFELGGEVGGALPSVEPVVRRNQPLGDIRVSSILATGALGVCWPEGRLRVCGAGKVGLERFKGSTRDAGSRLFREVGAVRTSAVFAAEGRLDFRLTERFGITSGLELLARPASLAFGIEGVTSTYTVPQASVAISLGGLMTVF